MYGAVVVGVGGCIHAPSDGHSDMACHGSGGVIMYVHVCVCVSV